MTQIIRRVIEPGFRYQINRPGVNTDGPVSRAWGITAARCTVAIEAKVPDTAIEIYFNLGPNGRSLLDASNKPRTGHRSAWVIGPHGDVLRFAKELVDCDIVAIRLQPGTAPSVLGVPADEIRDVVVDLDLFWGTFVGELADSLHEARDISTRLRIVERAVAQRLMRGAPGDRTASAVCAALRDVGGQSVGRIATEFGLTHRRVISFARELVGFSPATFRCVHRFRNVISQIHSHDEHRWARIAADAGYSDQPHLIHEFRRLSGLTPAEYAAKRSSVGEGFVPHLRVAPVRLS
jgi:AraC-like DNA-binding protein